MLQSISHSGFIHGNHAVNRTDRNKFTLTAYPGKLTRLIRRSLDRPTSRLPGAICVRLGEVQARHRILSRLGGRFPRAIVGSALWWGGGDCLTLGEP